MLGAIAGDIIGSVYEWENHKSKEFDLFSPEAFFTDDSVLTVALAEAILNGDDYGLVMKNTFNSSNLAKPGPNRFANFLK